MDKHFLEFWGNFLMNAAKGQTPLEEMARWIGQGFSGFEDLTALFKKFYGLDHLPEVPEETPEYFETWKKAAENFQKSFKEYLSLMNVVPKDDHLALVKKYEQLKKRAEDQKETIKHLKMLLGQQGGDYSEVAQSLQDLARKQGEQFQKTIESIAQFFKQENA